MANSCFSGRVRVEVLDTLKDEVVYSYEGDNKIVGADTYGGVGNSTHMLSKVSLGTGFVEYDHVPRKPNGDLEYGWYSADGLFYFKKNNSSVAGQNMFYPPSVKLTTSPIRTWEITTAAYVFEIGAFAGESLDCVFVHNVNFRDWSVIQIPAFVASEYTQIFVWYTLSFCPDTSEGSEQVDLAGDIHTFTYKPAKWNESPLTSNVVELYVAPPRVLYYTNVTSLGDNDGVVNGDEFAHGDFYLSYYEQGSMKRTATKFFDVGELNNAPNGISGLLVGYGLPYQYKQIKIDPPIMKNTDMKLILEWVYSWAVATEKVS